MLKEILRIILFRDHTLIHKQYPGSPPRGQSPSHGLPTTIVHAIVRQLLHQ